MGDTFSRRATEKIVRATKKVLGEPITGLSSPGRSPFPGLVIYEGELTTALTATTDGKNNATRCKARRYVPVPNDTASPPRMQLDTIDYNIVNRSKQLPALAIGTYIMWTRVGNEWRLVWADCGV